MLDLVAALAVAAVTEVNNDGYNCEATDYTNNNACNGAGREPRSGLRREVGSGDGGGR